MKAIEILEKIGFKFNSQTQRYEREMPWGLEYAELRQKGQDIIFDTYKG